MTCRWVFPAAGRVGWLRRVLIPIFAGTALAVSAVAASAQAPAALVVDIAGPSDPMVEAFDELEVGATLKLGPATEITVMHYASCRELRLQGGTVVIGEDALEYPGAKLLGGSAADCPEQVTVYQGSVVGAGVVLRGVHPRPLASPMPSFLLAVAGHSYEELRIQTDSQVVIRRPIHNARVAWDAGDAPLAPGDYTVVLAGKGHRMHAARIRVTADGPDLIVLRP